MRTISSRQFFLIWAYSTLRFKDYDISEFDCYIISSVAQSANLREISHFCYVMPQGLLYTVAHENYFNSAGNYRRKV